MEHECFEDEEVAALMNKFFISVKVDREERPDVDQVYMTAVQLMTQKGGWPLNCFTLPDGRPIYSGTYFPKEQWMHILRSLEHTWQNDREKALEYAENLHEGIIRSELIDEAKQVEAFSEERLHELVVRWARSFDSMEGSDARAPKFPLPSNYEFLLEYGVRYEHEKVLKHVELTLDKMAMGGIYDQVGGGFTRYSVDMLWKVPHFEKMLYVNGQLLNLYSLAYEHFQKPLYKRIVAQTVEWLQREMLTNEGAFYSALDADSEGEEGKFYCWTPEEMKAVLGDDFSWVKDFYNLNAGSWLIWMVIFNHMAESATYVIAVGGALLILTSLYFAESSPDTTENKLGLRQMMNTQTSKIWILGFVLLILFTVLGPTDIYPKPLRLWIVEQAQLKAFPCILIWVTTSVELLKTIRLERG